VRYGVFGGEGRLDFSGKFERGIWTLFGGLSCGEVNLGRGRFRPAAAYV